MNLSSAEHEASYLWLLSQTEPLPEPAPLNFLTYTIPTTKLYHLLIDYLRRENYLSIPIDDLWGIIQIAYPAVTIVGQLGSRVFNGVRLKYPPTKSDLDWVKMNAQAEIDWQNRWSQKNLKR